MPVFLTLETGSQRAGPFAARCHASTASAAPGPCARAPLPCCSPGGGHWCHTLAMARAGVGVGGGITAVGSRGIPIGGGKPKGRATGGCARCRARRGTWRPPNARPRRRAGGLSALNACGGCCSEDLVRCRRWMGQDAARSPMSRGQLPARRDAGARLTVGQQRTAPARPVSAPLPHAAWIDQFPRAAAYKPRSPTKRQPRSGRRAHDADIAPSDALHLVLWITQFCLH